MKWFDKWFNKRVQKAWNDARQEKQSVIAERSVSITGMHDKRINSDGMTFTVHRANGGHIIETRIYDLVNDRADSSLYVITDGKDLGEEIGKIITYEGLRA